MKAFFLCLYIATVVAWPSGVYIFGDGSIQFYSPLTEPHSQLNLSVSLRGDRYRVTEKFVAKTKCAPLIAFDGWYVLRACARRNA